VTIDPARVVPLFHAWIRDRAVEGTLIDVADYAHVRGGPAVVLIGHEIDYAVDRSEERAGLLYTRKRPAEGDLEHDLRKGLRRLLIAALAFERKPAPHPPVSFRTDELRVQAIDRLGYPRDAEKEAVLRGAVLAVAAEAFGRIDLDASGASSDPREPLSVRVRTPAAPDIEALLDRLGGPR